MFSGVFVRPLVYFDLSGWYLYIFEVICTALVISVTSPRVFLHIHGNCYLPRISSDILISGWYFYILVVFTISPGVSIIFLGSISTSPGIFVHILSYLLSLGGYLCISRIIYYLSDDISKSLGVFITSLSGIYTSPRVVMISAEVLVLLWVYLFISGGYLLCLAVIFVLLWRHFFFLFECPRFQHVLEPLLSQSHIRKAAIIYAVIQQSLYTVSPNKCISLHLGYHGLQI